MLVFFILCEIAKKMGSLNKHVLKKRSLLLKLVRYNEIVSMTKTAMKCTLKHTRFKILRVKGL